VLYPIVFALRGLSRARVKLLQYSRTDAG
jgi:hypothetical protein